MRRCEASGFRESKRNQEQNRRQIEGQSLLAPQSRGDLGLLSLVDDIALGTTDKQLCHNR